jgi:hypothetical protein
MMLIQENLYTEGHNDQARLLSSRLKEFFDQEPFDNGLDWNTQTLWAKMTDEQCVLFCLKYPQYSNRFIPV